jgi:hypothetical protein
MRVDCRHYVRDLALAATRPGALGLNSAACAQSPNAFANVKIQNPSWFRRGPSRCRLGALTKGGPD